MNLRTASLGLRVFSAAALLSISPQLALADEPAHNTLTPAEAAAGWKLLFDGMSTEHFRSFKKDSFPAKGWVAEGGALRVTKGGGGGDIITREQYADFELSLDFKCAPGANSGIIYRASEAKDFAWMTGPEFQVLDDAGHKDGLDTKHSVGALYDIIAAPSDKPACAPGQWHNARVRIKNGVLQHFLHGVKVVETRIDDDNWAKLVAGSKFKAWPGFGMEKVGHISLQDHGDDVWYRNIKVRDLSAPLPGEIAVTPSEDLSGWKPVVPDLEAKDENQGSVWSVRDGVLSCSGTPAGYIRTERTFTNFVLKLEWRWADANAQRMNSGVLLRLQEPDKVWPRSIEAQLASTHAGDFWCIDDFPMTTEDSRRKGRRTEHSHANERPVGEWNEYEIIVDGTNVTLNVNGDTLNRAWDCQEVAGHIALQSEGAPIQFRGIRIAEIR
jgi:hypothetical protein